MYVYCVIYYNLVFLTGDRQLANFGYLNDILLWLANMYNKNNDRTVLVGQAVKFELPEGITDLIPLSFWCSFHV